MKTVIACVVAFTCASAVAEFEAPPRTPQIRSDQAPRPWDLSIRSFVGYNDNVLLIPDAPPFFPSNGDEGGPYAGYNAYASYRLIDNADWLFGAAASIEQVYYHGQASASASAAGASDVNDYDRITFTPSIYARHRFTLCDRPASVGAAYFFRWDEEKDIEQGSGEFHSLSTDLEVSVTADLDLHISYTHGWDDFDVVFPATPTLNERDAQRDAMRIGGKYYFDERLRNLQLAYVFMNNDAEGDNFDYESHGFIARIESHLFGPVWGAAEFGYRHGNYEGFTAPFVTAPGREEVDVFTYRLQVIWVLDDHWHLDFYYTFTDIHSNQAAFEAEVHNIGAGVTFRF